MQASSRSCYLREKILTIVALDPPAFADGPSPEAIARRDIIDGVRGWHLWSMLGWLDIRQRYRRSAIGPFWLTISMGVTVAALGVLYSVLFRISVGSLLPWLTVGFIVWTFINVTITESCYAFIQAEGTIKQVQVPLTIHVMRVIWRNCIVLAHNLVIVPIIYVTCGIVPNAAILLAVPGLLLVVLNLAWLSLLIGMLCARFRDLAQIVQSVMQIGFYVTPIIWKPTLLPANWAFVLNLNPFYQLMELVRAPLLGELPPSQSWALAIVGLVVGSILCVAVYGRFHRRIPYWL